MANRLTRIVTRTGDDGSTGLADGTRVRKDDARIEAIGAVDELNSALGMVLARPDLPAAVRSCLDECQHELFDLGGELALPAGRVVGERHCLRLEQALAGFNAALPPLREFILPGGGASAAACHLARAIARRAERRCWTLATTGGCSLEVTRYLNRLSDLLFVVARVLARTHDGERYWLPVRPETPV